MKIISIVGARPNFMKIAPLIKELKKRKINNILLHTGQHYDNNMSKIFFDELGMAEPDIYLGIKGNTHTTQTAKIMLKLEPIFIKEKPDLIFVVGDVNSTLAASIVAAKMHIPIAHIEAGLRSNDRKMPEEINRILTDSISSYLFTPSLDGNKNLLNEGVDKKKIFFVGNIMIDSLIQNLKKIKKTNILKKYKLKKQNYILITIHRPSNVDNIESLKKIVNILKFINDKIKVVFPIHPRTFKMLKKFKFYNEINKLNNIIFTEPLGYLEFMNLVQNSKLILTDSGGIQEETTFLNIPCITLRENTERPITVTLGTNVITGLNENKIKSNIKKILNNKFKKGKIPKFWDGKTSERIIDILLKEEN